MTPTNLVTLATAQEYQTDQDQIYARQVDLYREAVKASPYLLGKEVLGFSRFNLPHLEYWDPFARKHLDPTGTRSGRVLVLQPRETFKTTFWSVTLAVWFLVNNPNLSILITSSNEKNAIDILRQIKNIFERSEKFRALFGDYVGPTWGQAEIIVKPRTALTAKEGSVVAVGRGTIITSKHFDVIIPDDLVSPLDRDSPAERAATLRYFQDLFDILKKDVGQMVVVGTRWHKQDLYDHIFKMNDQARAEGQPDKFATLVTPARNADGSLNFPTILSAARLDDLRSVKVGSDGIDISQFYAQYLLEPLAASEQIFKSLVFYDHSVATYTNFVTFIDPALSVKTAACYSAIVTLGRIADGEHKNKWGVVYASIQKRNATTLMADIIRIHKKIASDYTRVVTTKKVKDINVMIMSPDNYIITETKVPLPHDVFMEDNGFQALLADNVIRSAIESGYELPIVGRTTTTKKETRIASIEPAVTQGFILFLKDYATAPEGYRLLVEQTINFPQAEMDGPDALALAWEQTRGRFMNS